MSAEDELRAKILPDVSQEIMKIFADRELTPAEALSILGVLTAECLMDGDLEGIYWMSFIASMNGTILENTSTPGTCAKQVFACPVHRKS